MNCDCISRIEQNLSTHYAKEIGGAVEVVSRLDVAWGMSDKGMDEMLFVNVTNTAAAKGYVKGKKSKVFVSFCPFCGKDQREKEAA